jgi:hypothetical protein
MKILLKKLNKNNRERSKKRLLQRWLLILKLRWKLKELQTWQNLLSKKQTFKNFKQEHREMKNKRENLRQKFLQQSKVLKTLPQTK